MLKMCEMPSRLSSSALCALHQLHDRVRQCVRAWVLPLPLDLRKRSGRRSPRPIRRWAQSTARADRPFVHSRAHPITETTDRGGGCSPMRSQHFTTRLRRFTALVQRAHCAPACLPQ
jgi:hypothetical protein